MPLLAPAPDLDGPDRQALPDVVAHARQNQLLAVMAICAKTRAVPGREERQLRTTGLSGPPDVSGQVVDKSWASAAGDGPDGEENRVVPDVSKTREKPRLPCRCCA